MTIRDHTSQSQVWEEAAVIVHHAEEPLESHLGLRWRNLGDGFDPVGEGHHAAGIDQVPEVLYLAAAQAQLVPVNGDAVGCQEAEQGP